MYGVSKVYDGRAHRQSLDIAHRCENIHLFGDHIALYLGHEFGRIARILLVIEHLTDPLETVIKRCVALLNSRLVLPVRCDTVFGSAVHFSRSYLNLEGDRLIGFTALFSDNGGMKRFVAVGFRHRDIILESVRYGDIHRMDYTKRRITLGSVSTIILTA